MIMKGLWMTWSSGYRIGVRQDEVEWCSRAAHAPPWVPGFPGTTKARVGRLSVECGWWETAGGSETRPYSECLRRVFGCVNGVGGLAARRPCPVGTHKRHPYRRGLCASEYVPSPPGEGVLQGSHR